MKSFRINLQIGTADSDWHKFSVVAEEIGVEDVTVIVAVTLAVVVFADRWILFFSVATVSFATLELGSRESAAIEDELVDGSGKTISEP